MRTDPSWRPGHHGEKAAASPSTRHGAPTVTCPAARGKGHDAEAGADPDVAYAAALFVLASLSARRAIRTAAAVGLEIPGWAGSAEWMFDYQAWCLARRAPALGRPSETVAPPEPAGSLFPVVSAPEPLTTAATTPARLGLHRCLACGRIGISGFAAASPLLLPHQARTWRCVDRLACRTRRLQRSDPR